MTVFGAHLSYLGICALLLCITRAQNLPYNPSRILLSKSNDLVYALLPSSTTLDSKLLSLNVSASINTSNVDFKTLTTELPFASSQAFVPVIDNEDGISVYAGDCASGASDSSLWKFTPTEGISEGNGSWSKSTFEVSASVDSTDLPGTNFLSAGFTFSALLGETSSLDTIYIFGGMCTTVANTNDSTWQASANYSNHMLQFSPNTATEYVLELSSLSAPPIAEAGFSLTPLKATTSNSSAQTLTQQQNFIILGGHTQTAFTNFSQVAVFSLPEEAWSFQTIDLPSESSRSDAELAVRSDRNEEQIRKRDTSIDSRSGHTAVLTEDGSKMVVFGGWVGDIDTAANPQLAILELGAGYGGSGDWKWTLPSPSGKGITDGTGIYGHGAAMLPGNVMMVLGGYSIPNSSSASSKRDATNSEAYFFNATSMTWSSSYTNPSSLSSGTTTSSGGTSTSTAKEVGLGVGLSCGFSAIIIAGLFYMWYSRRLRRQRRHTREKDLQALSYGAATYCSIDPNHDPFRSSVHDGSQSSPYDNYNNAYLTDNISGYENLQNNSYNNGGNDFGADSSPTGNRRNSAFKVKGAYQSAPTFDPRGRSNSLGTAGPIHPIIEADEEEMPFTLAGIGPDSEPNSPSQNQGRNSITVVKRKPLSRPGTGNGSSHESSVFKEKDQDGLRSHPLSLHGAALENVGAGSSTDRSSSNPSPEYQQDAAIAAAEREAEMKEWVNDWAAADALLHTQAQMQSHSSAGRVSPSKYRRPTGIGTATDENTSSGEGRTESNLSESARSAISNLTASVGRSISQRSSSLSAFLTGTAPTMNTFTSSSPTAISPVFDRSPSGYEGLRGGNGYGYHQNQDSTGTSFTTALTHNSFPALRAEGESLLPRPPKGDSLLGAREQKDGSPSKIRGHGTRSVSWFGTLRKALTGSGRNDFQVDTPLYWSDADSPVHARGGYGTASDGAPRRTVSASATLWRRKQGRSDWEDSEQHPTRSNTLRTNKSSFRGSGFHDDPFIIGGDDKEMGYHGKGKERDQAEDEDEWDIERAVENRVVQVMFTVPKERLRVVNYDIEEDISEADQASLRSRTEKFGKSMEKSREAENRSPGRVREMVERFEGKASPGGSPVPGKRR